MPIIMGVTFLGIFLSAYHQVNFKLFGSLPQNIFSWQFVDSSIFFLRYEFKWNGELNAINTDQEQTPSHFCNCLRKLLNPPPPTPVQCWLFLTKTLYPLHNILWACEQVPRWGKSRQKKFDSRWSQPCYRSLLADFLSRYFPHRRACSEATFFGGSFQLRLLRDDEKDFYYVTFRTFLGSRFLASFASLRQ